MRSIRAGQTIKNVGERTKCKARKTQEVKAPEGNRNTRDPKNDNTRNKHREKAKTAQVTNVGKITRNSRPQSKEETRRHHKK